MSALDDILALDAQFAFASSDMAFEVESVVYRVNGLTARTLNAQVFRFPVQDMNGKNVPKVEVFIPRSETSTIGITTVNLGRDTVTVAIERGGTARALPVKSVISSDAGGFHLELI